MKRLTNKIAVVGALAMACASTQAQIITSEGIGGAAVGGIIGGVIGHNQGRGHTAEGAAIGAGVGLLL
ncbi:MAG: hypothetical protein M1608_17955, partial [Candidatus Omnitrophica bacterium]|nr:hypothetical protein [Candidatus Omnitrophota bacterium]